MTFPILTYVGVVSENAILLDHLRSTGALELRWTIRRDDDEWKRGVVRFDDGRKTFRHGSSARGDDGTRSRGRFRSSKCKESRASFIEMAINCQLRMITKLRDENGISRSSTNDEFSAPKCKEFGDDFRFCFQVRTAQ